MPINSTTAPNFQPQLHTRHPQTQLSPQITVPPQVINDTVTTDVTVRLHCDIDSLPSQAPRQIGILSDSYGVPCICLRTGIFFKYVVTIYCAVAVTYFITIYCHASVFLYLVILHQSYEFVVHNVEKVEFTIICFILKTKARRSFRTLNNSPN